MQTSYLLLFYSFTGVHGELCDPNKLEHDMVAISGNPAVDRYVGVTELGSFKEECFVKADASPLQCPITGLSRGTRYQTIVRACLPGSAGCGEAKVLPASTSPWVRFFCGYSLLTTEILLTCFLTIGLDQLFCWLNFHLSSHNTFVFLSHNTCQYPVPVSR